MPRNDPGEAGGQAGRNAGSAADNYEREDGAGQEGCGRRTDFEFDVTMKPDTDRTAVAKGDVLGVARIAGIIATKHTCELILLCHPLPLGRCAVNFSDR